MFGLFKKKKLKEGVDLAYLDDESHKRLKKLADENYRTLAGQACYILSNYLGTADNWAKEEFQQLKKGEPEKHKTSTPVETQYQDPEVSQEEFTLDDVLESLKNDPQPVAPVVKRTHRRKKHLGANSQALAVLEAMHACNPLGYPITTNKYLSLTRVLDVITDPNLGRDGASPPATILSSNIYYLRCRGYVEAVGKADAPVKTGLRDTMKQQTYRVTEKGKREITYHDKRRKRNGFYKTPSRKAVPNNGGDCGLHV